MKFTREEIIAAAVRLIEDGLEQFELAQGFDNGLDIAIGSQQEAEELMAQYAVCRSPNRAAVMAAVIQLHLEHKRMESANKICSKAN